MGRSLGMAAYRALSRRSGGRDYTPAAERTSDELVWIHTADPDSVYAVHDLARRICVARDGVQVLITVPDAEMLSKLREEDAPPRCLITDQVPSEHPEAVDRFAEHYKPDTGLWIWGRLRPNLLRAVQAADCPMMLADAGSEGFESHRDRWLPDLSAALLAGFQDIMARSPDAVRRLNALGVPAERVRLTSPMLAGGQTLACEDSDLADLSAVLGGRPVWLATRVTGPETEAILTAHRRALRLSHRLLLVLHPEHPDMVAELSQRFAAEGLRVRNWSDGEDPDDGTQVLIADDPADLGLFYRVAPVTFLGGTLVPEHRCRNPFEAAALGSAVLFGPHVSPYKTFCSQLVAAGAARTVGNADTLGEAVIKLIAPDQAAMMAHAGWDVTSRGAALTDEIIALITQALDKKEEARRART